MPFPVDYRGEVRWRNPARLRGEHLEHAVLHKLVTALAGANGNPTVQGTTVAFIGGRFRFVSHRTVLGVITHGSLAVLVHDDTVVVTYYLNFTQWLLVVSVFALFVLSLMGNAPEPLGMRFGFPAFVWVWAFGLNYFITILRFPAFVKRALNRV